MSNPKNSKNGKKAPTAVLAGMAEQKSVTEVSGKIDPQGKVALNIDDKVMFTLYENTIRANISGFMSVGMALKAIKDNHLHKVMFKDLSFLEYCRERWGLSDKYAYRLMDAFTCVDRLGKELSPIGETRFPTHESQVRHLTPLAPEEQVKAWKQVLKACKGKPITAVEVEQVVNKMLGQPSKNDTTQPKTSSGKVEQTKLMKIGKLVTEALEGDESKLTVPKLKKILEQIQKMIGTKK